MRTLCTTAHHPSPQRTWQVLLQVRRQLGASVCWLYKGTYHFSLAVEGWTLAISPDSAGRFRLSACRGAHPVATVWIDEDDWDRLDAVVGELRDKALTTAGA